MSNLPDIISQVLSAGYSMADNETRNSIPVFVRDYMNSTVAASSMRVDVVERSDLDQIIVYVDLPGVDPDTIEVDFFNNKVSIKGKREKKYEDNDTAYMSEIKYGNFDRSVMIPISVTSQQSVSVRANHGVLEITIDKQVEERNRFSVRVEQNTPE